MKTLAKARVRCYIAPSIFKAVYQRGFSMPNVKGKGKKPMKGVARKTAGKASRTPPRPASRRSKPVKSAARSSAKTSRKVTPPVKRKTAATRSARPAARPAKAVAKPPVKAAARPVAAPPIVARKGQPAPPPAKPGRPVAGAPRPATPAGVAPRPLAAKAPPKPATRARRPRLRIHSDGAPVANWLNQGEKPRPSSFIPAPPRAESPSLVAAPPASSDRLVHPEDVEAAGSTLRTYPVRVDIEQGAGRVFISVNPEQVTIHPGEGIEWDFRYVGGADVVVDEVIIEFEKPSPFSRTSFKSQKPGSARPHRQISGAASKASVGRQIEYTIRCMNPFKSELAKTRPRVTVLSS
jgi:hypothetical protein